MKPHLEENNHNCSREPNNIGEERISSRSVFRKIFIGKRIVVSNTGKFIILENKKTLFKRFIKWI